MLKKLLVLAILIAAPTFAQSSWRSPTYTLDAVESFSFAVKDYGEVASKLTVQVEVAGGPTTCTLDIEGRVNPSFSFVDLDNNKDCSANVLYTVTTPVTEININLEALSGGATPSIQVTIIGDVD